MLEPKELEQRRAHRAKKQKRKKRSLGILPLLITIIVVYTTVITILPVPGLKAEIMPLNFAAKPATTLPWPGYGQAALGAVGYGLLAQHGDQKPLPIASVAKVITAVAVLKQRPIIQDQTLPIISITVDDVATYRQLAAQDQSVIEVAAGERLTELEALQAMLLPSANNMADVLVRWAFGSMNNYLQFVNPFTKTLGMNHTYVDDASGYSPKTVSTAEDLAKLAEIAMNNPILAQIVAQPQAELPVAGTVYNVNHLVGQDGIVGIKTGNTDEAGGCYLFSVRRNVDSNHSVTLVGVVMGAADLSIAIDDSMPLINAAFKQFHTTTVIHSSQLIGNLTQGGHNQTSLVTQQGISIVTWDNLMPVATVSTIKLGATVIQGQTVGTLNVTIGDMAYSLPIVAAATVARPSLGWRLRHVAGYL